MEREEETREILLPNWQGSGSHGITIDQTDDGVFVRRVQQNSPAARMGVVKEGGDSRGLWGHLGHPGGAWGIYSSAPVGGDPVVQVPPKHEDFGVKIGVLGTFRTSWWHLRGFCLCPRGR